MAERKKNRATLNNDVVKSLRLERKLTLRQCAEAAGMPNWQQWQRLELVPTSPTLDVAYTVSQVLNVPMMHIVSLPATPPRNKPPTKRKSKTIASGSVSQGMPEGQLPHVKRPAVKQSRASQVIPSDAPIIQRDDGTVVDTFDTQL